MKQLQGSKAVAKLFSPAALALAVGLACWGSAALATNNPIPGVDIIVKKNPGDSIVVTPTSDHSGKFSVKLKEPGNYTISTACKSGGCTPSQLPLNVAGKSYPNADGTTTYEFTVGKGGLELRGQTLSVDLPKGAGSGGDKQAMYIGAVNLTTDADKTASNLGGGDTTPQNKYADDFRQLNTKLDALAIQVAGVTTLTTDMSSVKAQVTALQTAVAGLPTTASITALQTSLGSVDTKIDAITTTLNTVATAGTATKAIVDGLKTDLTALKTDLTAFAAKVTADNLAMKAQSTALKKEDKKNASVDNAVSGFGTGMGNSPGKGPDLNGMGGLNPGMIPAPPMPTMIPAMGGAGGPAGGSGAMSPGGQGGPVSSMHP